MDFEITVKYTLEDFCTKEELGDKTPYEFYKEIANCSVDYVELYSNKKKIVEAKIKNDK